MNLRKATSILLICSMIVIIIAITGCSLGKSYLKTIDFKSFEKKINHKDTFILLISNKKCPNCQKFEPKFKKVIKANKITVYKIDTYYLSTKDFASLLTYTSHEGTPTVEFYDKGNESSALNRIVGNTSVDVIKERLKDNGYIKE